MTKHASQPTPMKTPLRSLLAAILTATFLTPLRADEAKPAAPEKVTLGQIVTKPDQYEKKLVVFEARLTSMCSGDGCLVLKEKLDMIEGIPPVSGQLPALKIGERVRVTGTVQVKRKSGAEPEVSVSVKTAEAVKK